MALWLVTDSDAPTPAAVPPHPVALTASEITGLIGLFQTMLDAMEGRILERLDGNSRGAADRWAQHEREHAEHEKRLSTLEVSVAAHHQLAHDARIASDARIKPIRGSLAWMWAHWRDIVLLIIGLIALGTFVVESAGRLFGTHLP